jgi:hypothetical protein
MKKTLIAFFKQHLVPVLLAVWVALAPIHSAIWSVIALPFIDLMLAILVAIRTSKPAGVWATLRTVESKGIGLTINKATRYLAGVIIAYEVDTNLLTLAPWTLKVLLAAIGLRELKSCLEHLDDLGVAPVFAEVLTKLSKPPDDPENK